MPDVPQLTLTAAARPRSAAAPPGGRRLRTGEVAARAGVNVQTLRYYERRGLIAEPDRSPGGHRTYPVDTVTLLGVIKAAQRLGFTLAEVAELLDTGSAGHPTPDLRDRAAAKLAEVDRKLADLAAIRAALVQVVDARCDSLTDCTCADCPLPLAGPAGPADPADSTDPADPRGERP